MINKDIAEKLDKELRYGDKKRIAKMTGFHALTVIRFFNGKTNELAPETQDKIYTETLNLLNERQKRQKALERKSESITGN